MGVLRNGEWRLDPYGTILTDSGNGTVSVEHRFTSQEFDAETGLYYYGARYYNPSLGRFISADSIVPNPRDPQALNRYSYVRNNPLIYTDPTGHSWLSKAVNSINNGIDRFFKNLGVEVADTEVRASHNTNGVTTVSTPGGSWSSGGSAPQTQTERSITACSGGTCVGNGSRSSYRTGSTDSRSGETLYADSGMYATDAGGEIKRIDAYGKVTQEKWLSWFRRVFNNTEVGAGTGVGLRLNAFEVGVDMEASSLKLNKLTSDGLETFRQERYALQVSVLGLKTGLEWKNGVFSPAWEYKGLSLRGFTVLEAGGTVPLGGTGAAVHGVTTINFSEILK